MDCDMIGIASLSGSREASEGVIAATQARDGEKVGKDRRCEDVGRDECERAKSTGPR